MFRIRQVGTANLPIDSQEIARVQEMLVEGLPGLSPREIDEVPTQLLDPMLHKMRSMLFVADDLKGNIQGFALMSHAADARFCLLDYLVSKQQLNSRGIGGALYQRVVDAARALDVVGLFLECLPDDPKDCSNPALAATNASRLRFYERFGARPLINTGYETPIKEGSLDLPHLVFDPLRPGQQLRRSEAQAVIRAILERKYPHLCSPEYTDHVVSLVQEDPVQVRAPRYVKRPVTVVPPPHLSETQIVMVVNDRHDVHHVRERGYVEAPVRIKSILDGILPTGLFYSIPPRELPDSHIRAVHDGDMVDFIRRASEAMEPGKSLYPYVFPLRNRARMPRDMAYAAGYFCTDSFTPINRNAYAAARRAVHCALTAADAVLAGQRFAYALVRPPGHHAERRSFGGFCYFNNAAIAAHYLSKHGTVAILDVDYHHGNGQQDIFYQRNDVLTVSIHANPHVAYPFFTGFPEEIGEGDGAGFNLNLALPETVDGKRYRRALLVALERVRAYGPRFLVLSLGFDTAKRDPTGSWSLGPDDFLENGRLIAGLKLPTLIVQEGGYRTGSLGSNARNFFLGLTQTAPKPRAGSSRGKGGAAHRK